MTFMKFAPNIKAKYTTPSRAKSFITLERLGPNSSALHTVTPDK